VKETAGHSEEDRGFGTACWIWSGAICMKGYGRIKIDGRRVGAHRVYYERLIGPVPKGLHLDHLCRQPGCVNPAHLEPVTSRENSCRGLRAKLDAHSVRKIRSEYRPFSQSAGRSALSRKYGVSIATIKDVVGRRTWSEVAQ
jgi:hypothetical protein